MVEQFFALIKEERSLDPFECIKEIMEKLIQRHDNFYDAAKMLGEEQLNEYAVKCMEAETKRAEKFTFRVKRFNEESLEGTVSQTTLLGRMPTTL